MVLKKLESADKEGVSTLAAPVASILRNEGSFHKPAQTLLVVIRQAASFLNQRRERIPPDCSEFRLKLVKLS